jgi:hypothetical protein
LPALVQDAIDIARCDSCEDETTYDFHAPPDWTNGAVAIAERWAQLSSIEAQISEAVYGLYELSAEERKAIEHELAEPGEAEDESNDEEAESEEEGSQTDRQGLTREELADNWFSYAVGIALGRFEVGVKNGLGSGAFAPGIAARIRTMADPAGMMVVEEGHPDDLAQRILDILYEAVGDAETESIIGSATGTNGDLRQTVADYLVGSFFRRHAKRYRKCPVYWLLQSPNRNYSVYLFHERATENTLSLLQGKKYLGGRLHRMEMDLRQAKQKESTMSGRDKAGWAKEARDLAEVMEDLRAFDHCITAANNFSTTDRHGNQVTVRWQPELDDGVLLNAAPLHELMPSWKRADAKLNLDKVWENLEKGEYDWARTAMRYWPKRVWKACQKNKSFAIAHGLA